MHLSWYTVGSTLIHQHNNFISGFQHYYVDEYAAQNRDLC
jgi:hypothetical protein